MMRPLPQILREDSPLLLAREVAWRIRKRLGKKRILAQIVERPCVVTFREISYYKPDVATLSQPSRALLQAFADHIGAGQFPFLGYGTVNLSRRPKWNLDFVSGLDWPHVPLENRNCMRFDGSDVKAPYELSRLQFLPIVGKAYRLTGDERYRQTAKDLLSHWIQENPVGVGVNWSLAMEAALRGMSICFLMNLLSPFRPEEAEWLTTATSCLWHHLVYIEAHIEFSHLISSNHYLSNLIGLYCLSVFLEGRGMAQKRRVYRKRIEGEIARQVYQDGGDYEASTGYHVLVTQMFTTALLVMRANNERPEAHFTEKLRSMYRVMAALASDSGELPHIGDCDDGRVELLLDDVRQMLSLSVPERNSLRISNLLGVGQCLFGEGCGSNEDAKWYGLTPAEPSQAAAEPKVPLAKQRVVVFPQSGMAVARRRRAELLFFAIPNGICGKGSHTHNDKLSVVLRVDGVEVLCDSGTGTYTRDAILRNRLRVTSAHNTVTVDGKEQNSIDSGRLFQVGNQAEVTRIEHGEEGEELFFRASHLGFRSLGVTHARTVRLCDKENLALVEDLLDGTGRHRIEINFQFAPGWTAGAFQTMGSETQCRLSGPKDLEVLIGVTADLHAEQCESSVSMTYGSTAPAVKLRFWGDLDLPAARTTRICWTPQMSTQERR